MELSSEQERAVEVCLDPGNVIASVTGGAGTGKTTILKEVVEQLRDKRKRVALCAPTGRAAKRIEEATGFMATTIHRLLEFPKPGELSVKGVKLPYNEPKRNGFNPLQQDIVIVDEASMLSPGLYRQLMDALKRGAQIRFFGDNNQLAPIMEVYDVGKKPPFIDLLKRFPAVELTFNYRSGDAILANAQRILRGQPPERNEGFQIVYSADPITAARDMLDERYMTMEAQMLVPQRKGKNGTSTLNPMAQLKFNASGEALQLPRIEDHERPITVRQDDKFIWTKNDYTFEIFNGEMGYIGGLDSHSGDLSIVTPDRQVDIPARAEMVNGYNELVTYDPRRQIELGYAITVHKAQGSEFDEVLYAFNGHQPWLLNRRNFYTAVTRARKLVIVVCNRGGMGLNLRRVEL